MQTGAVWIIDDDQDDKDMVREIWDELKIDNKLVFFSEPQIVLDKLKDEKDAPFIIICDVNLPKMDGFKLRETMLTEPSRKFHSVPFIYWSTFASEEQIFQAYELSAHGFFIKEANFEELKESFKQIIRYWQKSRMPSKKKK